MEIVFESENSDLVIEFASDVFDENFSDRTEVRWNFSNKTHSAIMASLLDNLPEDGDSSYYLHTTLRLCC